MLNCCCFSWPQSGDAKKLQVELQELKKQEEDFKKKEAELTKKERVRWDMS